MRNTNPCEPNKMHWIDINHQGVVMAERVVAIGHADAAPIRRLISDVPVNKRVVLTGGQKRAAVLILDTGHIIITAQPISRITTLLRRTQNIM